MRWFCGFILRRETSNEVLPKPVFGRNIWDQMNPLWVCGNWAESEVIGITEGPVRVAILGRCIAPYTDVVESISDAIKANDYNRLARMPGNYNILVQDGVKTYIFTDNASLRPVFYVIQDSFVIYSSLSIPLHKLIEAKLNQHWLASYLVCGMMPGIMQTQSPFEGIKVMPPNHVLRISPEEVVCSKSYNQPQGTIDAAEAAEKLRKHLLDAVELRIDLQKDSVTSDLSGGVDSTSLSLISAKHLSAKGKDLQVITVEGFSVAGNEDTQRACHAVEFYPNIKHILVKPGEFPLPFSSLEEIPFTDEPTELVITLDKFRHVLNILKSRGSQLHISGEGGDAVLMPPIQYLADLVELRKIKTLIQHSYGWARVSHSSLVTLLNKAIRLSNTSYNHWLSQQVRKLGSEHMRQKQNSSWGWSGSITFANWYTQKAAELGVARLKQYSCVPVPFSEQPGQHASIASIYGTGRIGRVQQQIADSYDVNIDFPFLDTLVIDTCLQTKIEQRTTPFIYKALLNKALHHDLPKSVLTRSTKCDYTAELYAGLRKNIVEINKLFQTSYLSEINLINIKIFQTTIKHFSMGIDVGLCQFNRTIALELWIRRLLTTESSQFWEKITN